MKRILALSAITAAAVVLGPGPATRADENPCRFDPTCILTICVSGAGVLPRRFCVAE